MKEQTPQCAACGKSLPGQTIRIRNGRTVEEFHVCAECADLWAIGPDDSGLDFRVGDCFLPAPGDDDDQKECPVCRTRLSDIRLTGRTGCEECYAHFAREIRLLVQGSESGPLHPGRIPRPLETLRTAIRYQAKRRDRIRWAVLHEDFEEAARLRDEDAVDDAD